ncbi:MAG: DUF433 domain-containing protein [Okeania sp. SIO2H7]|nr:DUF433 domain-containing protein [Okeania sp. SIO2H7]
MTLKELEPQLLALTSAQKAEAIAFLARSLSLASSGIEKTPGVCGGDACIVNTRIPVWTLVNYRRLGATDAEILKDYPTLGLSDLRNAWAYAEANADEIEANIQENEEY